MEHLVERYYKLNRFLLSISGIWPYQSKWSARLARFFITIIMLLLTFFQLASLLVFDITMDLIIQSIQGLIPTLGTLCHLYACVRYLDKIKELFEHMWKDWALQKTNHEIKIMHEHAETTRVFTLHYTLLIYVNLVIYNIWIFTPEILDVISPMNESRLRTQPIDIEFFIDKERYFYLIRLYLCLFLFFLPMVLLTTSTLLLALTQHACGMCELLGYRAERLIYITDDAARCDFVRGTKINYGNMATFIQLSYNLTQFIGILETSHTILFLLDLAGIIFTIGITLTQMLSLNGHTAFRDIIYGSAILCYAFIPNYMGQKITDASLNIYDKVYNSAWYEVDASKQKSLLLIMRRRFHPLTLTACRVYVMSLQNFGTILQTAISYCMFMRRF